MWEDRADRVRQSGVGGPGAEVTLEDSSHRAPSGQVRLGTLAQNDPFAGGHPMTRIRYLGVSAFEIVMGDGVRVLVDPYLTGNPHCPIRAEENERGAWL